MLCQSLLYSKVIQFYIYMYRHIYIYTLLKHYFLFSIMIYLRRLDIVPYAIQ